MPELVGSKHPRVPLSWLERGKCCTLLAQHGSICHLCYHECHRTPRQRKPSLATKLHHQREAPPTHKPGSPTLPWTCGAPLWPTLLCHSDVGRYTLGSDGFVECRMSLEFTRGNQTDARPSDSQGTHGQVAKPPEGGV